MDLSQTLPREAAPRQGACVRARILALPASALLLVAASAPAQAHHRGFAPPPTSWWNPLVVGCAFVLLGVEAWAQRAMARSSVGTEPGAPAVPGVAGRLWTWLPLLLLVLVGAGHATATWTGPASLVRYYAAGREPDDALAIEVRARQFEWAFDYGARGAVSRTELHVPADTPVRLRLTSSDTLHSFEVPQWGLKRDLIPGAAATVTFRPLQQGRYPVYCAVLCGKGSSEMEAVLVVEAQEQLDAWLLAQHALSPGAAPPRPPPRRTGGG